MKISVGKLPRSRPKTPPKAMCFDCDRKCSDSFGFPKLRLVLNDHIWSLTEGDELHFTISPNASDDALGQVAAKPPPLPPERQFDSDVVCVVRFCSKSLDFVQPCRHFEGIDDIKDVFRQGECAMNSGQSKQIQRRPCSSFREAPPDPPDDIGIRLRSGLL